VVLRRPHIDMRCRVAGEEAQDSEGILVDARPWHASTAAADAEGLRGLTFQGCQNRRVAPPLRATVAYGARPTSVNDHQCNGFRSRTTELGSDDQAADLDESVERLVETW
jgi:hypothetical protein